MATKDQSMTARMVPQEGKRKSAAKAPTGLQAFMSNMLSHPDIKEASAIVAQQAEHEFDAAHGSEIEQLNRVLPNVDTEYKTSHSVVTSLKKTLDQTEPYVKAAADESHQQNKAGFKDWGLKDKILLLITSLALVAAMLMGTANIYANLMASGVTIFLTKPYLALVIALLLPIASIAIKNITHYIHNPLLKRHYGLGIYAFTMLLLLVWGVLFAMNYSGVTGGFDPSALLEDNSTTDTGAALVWTQLMLELLMGSALFLTIEEITSKYAPECFAPNMAYFEAEKTYQTALNAHQKLEENYTKKHGRLVQLYAEQQKFINEKTAEYIGMRSRRAAHFSD